MNLDHIKLIKLLIVGLLIETSIISYSYSLTVVDNNQKIDTDILEYSTFSELAYKDVKIDNYYIYSAPIYRLSLTTSGTGKGTVECNPMGPYNDTTNVTVWANASIGSTFAGFSGALNGTTTPQQLTMDGNKAVNAQFDLTTGYTLTLTTSGTGSGTIEASPVAPYDYGEDVTIWANASTGSTFAGFSGALNGTTTPQQLTIEGNKAVGAQFDKTDEMPIACFSWVDADGTDIETMINLDATCSTDDNGITLYEWDWNNDGNYDSTGMTTSHDYSDTTVHTIVLRVTDMKDQTDLESKIVQANVDNFPVACFTWSDADGSGTGTLINFNAGCSSDDQGITTYEWDWNNDGTYDYTGGPTTSHNYGNTATHTVLLRVTDTINQKNISSISNIKASISGGGGGGGGGGSSGGSNTNPVANASKGEPYQGYVGYSITFDASLSYDPDGENITCLWNFGDGATGLGVQSAHSYSENGNYVVILTVLDERGLSDSDQTSAFIQQVNYPPSPPIISGGATGESKKEFTYTFRSFDQENDTIKYNVLWGDDTTAITESFFIPNGTAFSAKHMWNTSGKFIISAIASDNVTVSEPSTFAVYVDALQVGMYGYFIDRDSDGTYDRFHNETRLLETNLGMENINYLIDDDGDGIWDHTYNRVDGLNPYMNQENNTPGFEFVILLTGIVFVFYWKRKK